MKAPLATERLIEPGPDHLQVKGGGGCLSIFGIPFFAAGVFVCLIAAGVVVPDNADELPWWGWPLMLSMGLIFAAVGGHLVFGRSWISIHRSRGVVLREWGLLVPFKSTEIPLQNFAAIGLGYVAGDSDSAERYPIVLQARPGCEDLPLLSGSDYASGRGQAERIAAFVGLPLADSTTDHESIHAPETFGESFRDRRPDRSDPVVRPATTRTVIEESGRSVRLHVPGSGSKPALLFRLVIPAVIGLVAGSQFVSFLGDSDTPSPVRWGFLAFLSLFFLLPALAAVASFGRAKRSGTIVTVSPEGITLDDRKGFRSRSRHIPADAILEVDFSTAASRAESRRLHASIRPPRSVTSGLWKSSSGTSGFGVASAGSGGTGPLPRWVLAIVALMPSGGVILKTRMGWFTFGAGLPDDEVMYLHHVVRQALLR
jgi:hypothetical protein